ncbi:MAG: S-formylglutathione hydrolase [Sphingomonadales bacterium]|nr:MAG: S-formylglutathione hydrolase [Sphingomonadales bacterium]
MALEIVSRHGCFGGTVTYYRHASSATGTLMRFSAFVPANVQNAPLLWFLSGLTCTEDNFTVKGGAYRQAAALGLVIVAPDTSPRGADVPDDPAYDFGQGAGFYINATQAPWATHFQMERYIAQELPQVVAAELPVDMRRQGLFGHSMGGHGALTLALKYPQQFTSISAFAPIAAPTQVPWGRKAFTGYLGSDEAAWQDHDACVLMRRAGDRRAMPAILLDQGADDPFLHEQLRPELFEAACAAVGQALILRRQTGYDHGYFFVSTFIDDHLLHHAAILNQQP